MRTFFSIVLVGLIGSLCQAAIDDILKNASPDHSSFSINADGTVRVEYDILLTKEQWEERQALEHADHETRVRRKAEKREEYRWTNNEIPYEIPAGEFTADVERMITDAMRSWEKYVCITFRPRRSSDKNYIYITINGPCSSYVGMNGFGQQYLTLGSSCHIPSIILHELGHAIGFEHEQCRSDRDDYISLLLENVYEGQRYNFDHKDTDNRGIEYDYHSIMHYSEYAFSGNGQRTIITKDPDYQHKIGYSHFISYRDVKLANSIYKCGDKCSSCSHYGDAYADSNCQCRCPGTPAKICGTTGGDDGLEGCVDSDDDCEDTAAYGYCETGRDYALVVCPKSCGCGDPSRAVCKDMNDNCDYYKDLGDCDHSDFMKGSCRKTCGFCGGNGDTGGNCVDNDSNCKAWADWGECDNNPGYMHENCAKSCGTC